MEPIYISVSMEDTGRNIRALMLREGYSVRDIQSVMGFAYPQAVYNWISGRTLPAIENLLILSRLFHTSVENILVLDEDVAVSGYKIRLQLETASAMQVSHLETQKKRLPLWRDSPFLLLKQFFKTTLFYPLKNPSNCNARYLFRHNNDAVYHSG